MIKCCILILLDGLGDRAHPQLDDMTPLQAASTPYLDRIASLGSNGLLHCGRPGQALPSEEAHFALFGYRQEDFPGRGVLEAIGAGIDVSEGDVAVLSHLVSVERQGENLLLEKDRPKASPQEIEELISSIPQVEYEGLRLSFRQTKSLDGIVFIQGATTKDFSDTDPLMEGMLLIEPEPLEKLGDWESSRRVCAGLKEFITRSYSILDQHQVNQSRRARGLHPLNAVVTHRPGMLESVMSFQDMWGLRALSISSGMIYWGLCKYLGMEVEKVRDGADPGADLAERLDYALSMAERYGFIHVHTKAPDVAAHTKDPEAKKEVIESLDKAFEKVLQEIEARNDILFVIASDHSTPSSGPLIHSGETVPVVFAGPAMRRDRVCAFDEISCSQGCLGHLQGLDFMPMVLNAMDRIKMKGLMDTPEDQPYWPGNRRPFRLAGRRKCTK